MIADVGSVERGDEAQWVSQHALGYVILNLQPSNDSEAEEDSPPFGCCTGFGHMPGILHAITFTCFVAVAVNAMIGTLVSSLLMLDKRRYAGRKSCPEGRSVHAIHQDTMHNRKMHTVMHIQ